MLLILNLVFIAEFLLTSFSTVQSMSVTLDTENSEEGEFSRYKISKKLVKRLRKRGILKLYPVQYKTFDSIYNGNDAVVLARTGTGKTLAFSLPIVQILLKSKITRQRFRKPVVLVLAPTRELVVQITTDFQSLCEDDLSILSVYGGVPIGRQCSSLRNGVDVLIGTPGRIIDLTNRGALDLSCVNHVVLDEVDRMLDMGFSKDVCSIISHLYIEENQDGISTTKKPQTLLFSATMPPWVSTIARDYLSENAFRLSLVGEQENKTALNVTHLALPCNYSDRATTLSDVIRLYCNRKTSRCIVFCERKKEADELAAHAALGADCHVFHGDISQDQREQILEKFREGKYHTLITTNLAARGLDVPDIDLVIQCQPPADVEAYVHRSGRTGRADRSGTSILFYTALEKGLLTSIEQRAGITFRRISAPTLQDIMDSWGADLINTFANIPEQTWSAFIPTAQKLTQALDCTSNGTDSTVTNLEQPKSKKRKHSTLEEDEALPVKSTGPLRALCCALAQLSGRHGVVESRSLFNDQKGWTTFKLEISSVAHRKGEAYAALRQQLPESMLSNLKNMSFIKGHKGFVFDVPADLRDSFCSTWQNTIDSGNLEPLTQLPELEPEESHFGDRQFGRPRGAWRGNSSGRGFNYAGRGRGFRAGHNGLSFRSNSGHQWGNRNFVGPAPVKKTFTDDAES
ncbi:unnamed protein product [Dicrocoelium dendriticum]|nr:unnamed protein product [Dicrocoelium dendriticum]